jgi:hypothetical protein
MVLIEATTFSTSVCNANRWRTHFARTKITLLIEATMFAKQPVYNAAGAANALRSDQKYTTYI